MSSGVFASRAFRIGAMCRRLAIIALKSSKKSPLIPVLQAEDRHAADMHRHLGRLEIEEGRINRRQFTWCVTHGSLPRENGASGALVALLASKSCYWSISENRSILHQLQAGLRIP